MSDVTDDKSHMRLKLMCVTNSYIINSEHTEKKKPRDNNYRRERKSVELQIRGEKSRRTPATSFVEFCGNLLFSTYIYVRSVLMRQKDTPGSHRRTAASAGLLATRLGGLLN